MQDVIALYKTELGELYEEGEIVSFLKMLSEWILGWDTIKYLTSKNEHINQSDLLKFHWALEELKQHRPLQHIIGWVAFCGCEIEVNNDVLIPRPETEEIVTKTISITNNPNRIADLCCGSGCIGIALKKAFQSAEVTGIDYSQKALSVAQRNAKANGTDINLCHADILKDDPLEGTYDLIISNPPYIRQCEKVEMRANVLDHEPHMALFVSDDDPLAFYRAIGNIAKRHLSIDGALVFEINEFLGKETLDLLREQGYNASIEQDFKGADRMIVARMDN